MNAIDKIFHYSRVNQTYNIGGLNEWKNIDLVNLLIRKTDNLLDRKDGHSDKLITFISDRPGHDLRYALDGTKLKKDLDWSPSLTFEEGLVKTTKWYINNKKWLQSVTSGEYQSYYKRYYDLTN